MKTCFTLLFFFCFLFLSAQENYPDERIYLAEMNAGESLMNFRSGASLGDYDVTHYKLELTVDPAVSVLNGVVTTSFTTLSPMNFISFAFDDGMTVSAVIRKGNNLSFIQTANDKLIIQFNNTIPAGLNTSVVIIYSGIPVGFGFGAYVRSYHSGTPIIWTLSEPYGAKIWWPCKQNLTDKADSLDVYVTAPANYTAVSNGVIESITTSGGYKTTHWDHDYPIPAYLVAFAVTNYAKYTRTGGSGANTFPIVNYVFPEDSAYIYNKTSVTPGIMNFFENTFEPYPYNDEKYGHCQFGWGGGMEHTTISFMGSFSRSIIAHELAHQWFGDKITCGSWQDIWLNEGFATYCEGLIVEHYDGALDFQNWRKALVLYITSLPGGSVYVPASDTLNTSRIFSSRLTYDKGAMVLHMLRKRLGDATFFQAVKDYLADPNLAYGFATTPDLKAHMESASGLNLDGFFQDWIYDEGYPSYTVFWHQNPNNDVVLTFTQTQSHPSVNFFEAEVTLRFIGVNDSIEKTFKNTSNGQQFTVNVPFNVNDIKIDPNWDLISGNNSTVLKQKSFSKIDLVLYPNPVEERLYIEKPASLKINTLKIIDMLGRTVKKYTAVDSYYIPTSGLRQGVYFVELDTSEGRYHKKIIKK